MQKENFFTFKTFLKGGKDNCPQRDANGFKVSMSSANP